MGIPTIQAYTMPKESDFPANKVSWQIDPDRAVLLIHDMQHYFLNFYDKEQSPITELIHHTEMLKRQCKTQRIPVVYTAQPGDQNPGDRALLTDFWGEGLSDDPAQTGITDALAPELDDLILTKWRYSAFKKTDFLHILQEQGRDQLIICGIYAHIGCLITAAEAFMYDIKPFLVGDAVADFSPDDHRMAMEYAAKRCAFTISTEEVIQALQMEKQMDKAEEPVATDTITLEAIRKQVAEILDMQAEALSDTDDLFSLGLDSIRLMSMVELWRQDGLEVNFMDLAEKNTLSEWWSLINKAKEKV
ncbi:isochorismatase family protein [Virgibacillus halophilus]|uniref:isochorismatase family protein n=1 Tax=Tigheibacillus halophilus TaxID=361280 RepID=UPI00363347DE